MKKPKPTKDDLQAELDDVYSRVADWITRLACKLGVKTACEVANFDDNQIDKAFGVVFEALDARLTAKPTEEVVTSLTREQAIFTTHAVADWLRVLAEEGWGQPSEADATHSSLLWRLLSGKKPLDKPPPKRYAYPDYALAEGEAVENVEIGMSDYNRGKEYDVTIDQSTEWKWIDKEAGLLQHKTWGQFRTWVGDSEVLTKKGTEIHKVRMLQRIMEEIKPLTTT